MESSRKGHVTLNGFLASWAVTTAADPRRTLAYAYYLGWVPVRCGPHDACAVQCARGVCSPGDAPPTLLLSLHSLCCSLHLCCRYPEDAPADKLFTVTRPRRQERRGDGPRRSVLRCHLFAAGGVGGHVRAGAGYAYSACASRFTASASPGHIRLVLCCAYACSLAALPCCLCGAEGVDATPVLEDLVTQARAAHGTLTQPIRAAAAAVAVPPPSGGGAAGAAAADGSSSGSVGSVTLIMRAVSEGEAAALTAAGPGAAAGREELQRCDVAAFLFDSQQPGGVGGWVLTFTSGGGCVGGQVFEWAARGSQRVWAPGLMRDQGCDDGSRCVQSCAAGRRLRSPPCPDPRASRPLLRPPLPTAHCITPDAPCSRPCCCRQLPGGRRPHAGGGLGLGRRPALPLPAGQ